ATGLAGTAGTRLWSGAPAPVGRARHNAVAKPARPQRGSRGEPVTRRETGRRRAQQRAPGSRTAPPRTAPRPLPPVLFRAAAALTLALLLAHAWAYRFQCDDAFISFRYARNLGAGLGLVFNPGLERVEGYTNFLWVVLLAALQRVGLRPEWSADVLSLGATVALWACVVAFAARGERAASALALVPRLLLAVTPS